jgi:O-antigen/teichoic acid export membrane protein
MIPQKKLIADAAYYAVAVFIGSVIEAPGRAMSQIVQPLTAKAINENNHKEIASLYKKSSINLLLISGLIFLLVNVNVAQLYTLIDDKYAQGIWVVLMISTAKLYHMFLGNNGAIISNSKYYKILLPYALAVALSVVLLNYWLIDLIGINGAGLATLIVILIYNTIKIWYVKRKFGILPFTDKTLTLLVMLLVFFSLFYFWEFPFHPIVNIFLKSLLLGVLYLMSALKLNIAPEATQIWHQFKGLFLKK